MTDRTDTLPPPEVIDTHLPTGVRIYGYRADTVRRLIAEAVAAEREACARVCEQDHPSAYGVGGALSMRRAAKIIRARGEA